ncbi:hypothetical protein COCC4DRAFT_83874 [Bipolaris maydis ATCC 48331]|uniref:Uncharacterized protein n=2 Tax=Cochliobolus heterostrophus TaxID=5016 RepID=M2UVC5_COCH5|nr:uncharacterized protein COCC4DRAFT_83874 [Bipolaris maydis ATCC 48331]EMD97521.1 hypothetical protein COCHEDRAFT_1200203 [Bipolaris maydis C5]ENI01341.1 hypothetical protein COCC4DRAFT_83874 [Bipolaris maydis ATCC 48331]
MLTYSKSSTKVPDLNTGVIQSDANIIQIERGEEIGRTDMSDGEIGTHSVYKTLPRLGHTTCLFSGTATIFQ